MKHILDSEFRYKPSFDTDIRKTFERLKRQQQRPEPKPSNVKQLPAPKVRVK